MLIHGIVATLYYVTLMSGVCKIHPEQYKTTKGLVHNNYKLVAV